MGKKGRATESVIAHSVHLRDDLSVKTHDVSARRPKGWPMILAMIFSEVIKKRSGVLLRTRSCGHTKQQHASICVILKNCNCKEPKGNYEISILEAGSWVSLGGLFESFGRLGQV